jgi:hypothetical protein
MIILYGMANTSNFLLLVTQNRVFIHVLRNTWYFTFVLFVINLVAVYVSLDSFIRPLERVAQQLKKNKKVGPRRA